MEKIRPYLLGAALTAVVIFGMAQAQPPNGPRWEYLYIEQAGVQFELRDRNAAGRGPRLLQAKLLNQLAPTAGRWCRPAWADTCSSAACLKGGKP